MVALVWAAMTKYHRTGELEMTEMCFLGFQRLEVQNRISAGRVLMKALFWVADCRHLAVFSPGGRDEGYLQGLTQRHWAPPNGPI